MDEEDKYNQLGVSYAKALEKSMKQTLENACNIVEGFKDLTPLEQEFVKQIAVANVAAHFGGFNKKEINNG